MVNSRDKGHPGSDGVADTLGSAAQPTQLEVGSDFAARYRVRRCLKSGGMGSVYEVLDTTTNRLRALKVMLPQIADDEDMRARFLREASVVGRVCSDHIVEVVDAGIGGDADTPFLVMELLRGEDFGTILERGPLRPKHVATALSQAALGLDKVHAECVIHRDLKPENLFNTTRDDGSTCLKILDFGIAKVTDQLATLHTTRSLGTPLYMAPEQLIGEDAITAAADLYSLAQVAFCLLVGKPYWFEEAKRTPSIYAFVNAVVAGNTEPATVRAARLSVVLPASFDRWFAKATATRVDHRFESATEQIDALAEVLLEGDEDVVKKRPTNAPPREEKATASPKPSALTTRNWLQAGGLFVIVAAFIALASAGDFAGDLDATGATTKPSTSATASAAPGPVVDTAPPAGTVAAPSSAAGERPSSLAKSLTAVPVPQQPPLGVRRSRPTLPPRPAATKPSAPAPAKPSPANSPTPAPGPNHYVEPAEPVVESDAEWLRRQMPSHRLEDAFKRRDAER